MSNSRRDFIKFVVVGSVAAGCPIDSTLVAESRPPASGAPPLVDGEHFEICHQIRDGHAFDRPDATRKADVVIIGGGVAGLSAAYSAHGLRPWEVNLEGGKGEEQLDSSQITTTRTVTVSTQERPVQPVGVDKSGQQVRQRMNRVSTILLLYPVIYIILTMPLAISRIAEFAGQEWGLTYVYVGAAIFDCSGLANVLL